eukprot:TRINITY_DN58647_c0_g1_i1.p1 TRINITY_DN58647_c0_g1~~TRINITY_DN58647_c0_g1_i1.p1  ORF type:complete len:341 (+),score=58.89 TRINITY_DN58647_c0_g1_i1:127-1149(+)
MNVLFLGCLLMLLMNTSWKICLALMLGMVILFLVNIITRQESMLYVPCVMPGMQTPNDNPEGMRSPKDKGMDFEDVYLETADGVRIHGWFIPVQARVEENGEQVDAELTKNAPTFLFCHENAGNIGLRMTNFIAIRNKLQVNILAFDYRGYGHSEGTPSEEGLIEDALTNWRWLSKAVEAGRLNGNKLYVFGRSLGGAVTVALAKTLQDDKAALQPAGLILENTFVSINALVDSLFPILAFKSLKEKFLRLRWVTEERIPSVTCPMLFITGEKDEIVPASHSAHLRSKCESSVLVKSIVFENGMHNDTWEKGGERYWAAQLKFIEECQSKQTPGKPEKAE